MRLTLQCAGDHSWWDQFSRPKAGEHRLSIFFQQRAATCGAILKGHATLLAYHSFGRKHSRKKLCWWRVSPWWDWPRFGARITAAPSIALSSGQAKISKRAMLSLAF